MPCSKEELTTTDLFGEAKVYETNMSMSVDHHILGFEISIYNPIPMQETECRCDFGRIKLGRRDGESDKAT